MHGVATRTRHDDWVAENEPPPNEAPTPPSGLPALPGGSPPAALPPGLDADEYRRFLEFQRFQDYQRFVETSGRPVAAPAPAPSHDVAEQLAGVRQHLAELSAAQTQINRTINPPRWKKILRSRWVHRLAWLAVIVIIVVWGVPILIDHVFNSPGRNTAQNPDVNRTLEANPTNLVFDVYQSVASPDQKDARGAACHLFNQAAADQFSAVFHTSRCEDAITKLHTQVTDSNAYPPSEVNQMHVPSGSTMVISSCSFPVTGGPRLGTFITTQLSDKNWQITGYTRQEPCPAPTSASAPPT